MSETSPLDDEEVKIRAKRLLDMSTADLDPATVHRLQRVRLAALQAKPVRRAWLVVAGGLAMVVLIFVWTVTVRQPPAEHHAGPIVEDIDLVLSAENVELADDLEFYHWLADVDTTG